MNCSSISFNTNDNIYIKNNIIANRLITKKNIEQDIEGESSNIIKYQASIIPSGYMHNTICLFSNLNNANIINCKLYDSYNSYLPMLDKQDIFENNTFIPIYAYAVSNNEQENWKIKQNPNVCYFYNTLNIKQIIKETFSETVYNEIYDSNIINYIVNNLNTQLNVLNFKVSTINNRAYIYPLLVFNDEQAKLYNYRITDNNENNEEFYKKYYTFNYVLNITCIIDKETSTTNIYINFDNNNIMSLSTILPVVGNRNNTMRSVSQLFNNYINNKNTNEIEISFS